MTPLTLSSEAESTVTMRSAVARYSSEVSERAYKTVMNMINNIHDEYQ